MSADILRMFYHWLGNKKFAIDSTVCQTDKILNGREKKTHTHGTLVGIANVPIVKQTEVNKKLDPLN